jgi:hypothetical protein
MDDEKTKTRRKRHWTANKSLGFGEKQKTNLRTKKYTRAFKED